MTGLLSGDVIRNWAKIRGESEPSAPATPEAPKPKRRISKKGMARIIAATKKRWRLAKVAKAQPPVTKKVAVKKPAKKPSTKQTAKASTPAVAQTAG